MLIEHLAHAVADTSVAAFPSTLRDGLARHVFDCTGAAYAGATVAETRALAEAIDATGSSGPARVVGFPTRTSLLLAATLGTAAARCSEMDDIHLAACITPGSIVVPTALSVASMHAQIDADTLLAGCLAGYETLIRFGLAIDGPRALYAGVWPTSLCAGFGAAATAARLLGLSATETAHALAMVAASTASLNPRTQGLTSRWLLVAQATQQALLSVLAAAHGLHGDLGLLDETWPRAMGVSLSAEALTQDYGQTWQTAGLSAKPYAAARQTIASIHAFVTLLQDESLDADDVQAVLVEVPSVYARMIDHAAPPIGRHEAISDVRFHLACAAVAPTLLLSAVKDTPADERFLAFWHTIDVQPDRTLDRFYPLHWPGRVTLATARGASYTREVLQVPGDPEAPLSWEETAAKYASPSLPDLGPALTACQALPHGSGDPSAVLASLETLAPQ